jgi:hypothetical protein
MEKMSRDRRLKSLASDAGFFELPKDVQEGLKLMLVGAIEVLRAHADDPERGDIGWRKQSVSKHLRHASTHCHNAYWASHGINEQLQFDDDGLEHWKHAVARIGLACAAKALGGSRGK